MDKKVHYKLRIKKDFSSDLVEQLRHIDKYFSKFINANVEIVVKDMEEDMTENFTVEINGKIIEDPTIPNIVDIANMEAKGN